MSLGFSVNCTAQGSRAASSTHTAITVGSCEESHFRAYSGSLLLQTHLVFLACNSWPWLRGYPECLHNHDFGQVALVLASWLSLLSAILVLACSRLSWCSISTLKGSVLCKLVHNSRPRSHTGSTKAILSRVRTNQYSHSRCPFPPNLLAAEFCYGHHPVLASKRLGLC